MSSFQRGFFAANTTKLIVQVEGFSKIKAEIDSDFLIKANLSNLELMWVLELYYDPDPVPNLGYYAVNVLILYFLT